MPCQLIGWDHYLGRKRMPYYIVNKNAQPNTRDHEVHLTPRTNCSSPRYPAPQNRESLGFHSTCHESSSGGKKARLYNGKWLLLLFKRLSHLADSASKVAADHLSEKSPPSSTR